MGRLALLTGAAGDLGRAAALALAADGWELLLTDHPARGEALGRVRADCRALGVRVDVAGCDVTRHTELTDVVAAAVARSGPPTAVVASAGVQGDFRPVHEYDLEAVSQILDVNVAGVLHTVAIAARAMVNAGVGGAIVTLGSMAGVSGAPNMPAYSASKAAVVGLTKSAAKDLAPFGIRVNAVSPAFIGPGTMWDTQVTRQAAAGSQYFDADPAGVARQMIEMIPLRRYGTPAEVADVIAYLVSPRASYLTGVNVEVSGGSV